MTKDGNRMAIVSSHAPWILLLSSSILLSLSSQGGVSAAESCPQCRYADDLLVHCNSSLNMLTWPGKLIYQVDRVQAPCGCNQNYYDQMVECLRCQSSSSATYSVKDLEGYKLVCTSFGETWKEIHIPDQTTTSTTTLPTTTTTLSPVPSNGSSSGGTSTSTNHLSSGAIAGIVVSVVALVVALSVAGYVWRRRRENLQHRTNDEYKYSDSQRDSYMEVALPQYTGMIQPTLPPIAKVSNLRVMNPDSDDEDRGTASRSRQQEHSSFEVNRNSSPGWRRGSFDDD